MAAHLARVDLSAHGFYATPDITGFGGDRPFSYFTYGAAASEVELDTLSGDFQVRRSVESPPSIEREAVIALACRVVTFCADLQCVSTDAAP